MTLITGDRALHVQDMPQDLSDPTLLDARWELSDFIRKEAAKTAHRLGFGPVGSRSAPTTYDALCDAVMESTVNGTNLAVSNENLNGSLLMSHQADLDLRFWHDCSHVERKRPFAAVDELDLGLWHVAVAKADGLSALALHLLDADLVGQTLLYAAIKGYAVNQLHFDLDVITFGVADAIVLEKERQKVATN